MKKTTIPTRAQVEQQAADLAAQLDVYRQQDEQQAAEDHRRKVEAQRAFDEQLVAGFSSTADEAAVRQARETLAAELANNPIVHAFADYITTLRRISHGQLESAHLSSVQRPALRAGHRNGPPMTATTHGHRPGEPPRTMGPPLGERERFHCGVTGRGARGVGPHP